MMLDQLLRGLKHARRKRMKGAARLGTVSGFLKRMADVCGVDEIASYLKTDPGKVSAAIKRAQGKFTFFDEKNAEPAYIKCKNDKGEWVVKGKPLKGDEDDKKGLPDGILMEFDCVITTGRRDRDGDVLDPKGAMVDPKMPLLWQHMPFQPVGKMVKLLEQSDTKVTGRFQIVDTTLGKEAATLVKTGCLRISHGFAPVEYNPLKDENGKDMGGWNISKYAMMEASLVSIPSNVDAEIEQFDAGKLHDPLIKSFLSGLKDAAKRKSWAAGFSPLVKAAGPAKKGNEDDEDEEKKRKKEDDEDDKEEKDDEAEEEDEEEDEDEDEEQEEEEKDDGTEEDEEEESTADEDGDGDEEGNDSDGDASTDGGEDGKSVRPLGEIIDGVTQLAKDQSLPKEAQRRLLVVAGMFEDVDANIAQSADKLAEAAKTRDLVSIFTETANLTESCVAHIGRASEELERVADVADLPDSAKGEIGAAVEDARNIMAAVSMMNAAADEAEEEVTGEDEDGDGDQDGGGEDDDPDAEEVAEAESDGTDDEYDDDDDDEDEMKEEGEDDRDEKEDDDEDQEEKDEDADEEKGTDDQDEDDDDENPEAEPNGGANPGTNSGRSTTGRRRLSQVLGRKLMGERLTEEEKKLLKQADHLISDDE